MRSEPDLEALRSLMLIAQESSISAASGRLGVSQQAVSLRIRSLERSLGVRLLVRSARGSRLTPAGELVVGWARKLLEAADGFSDAVDSLRSDRARTMRIAASLTIAEYLLPEWIARWRARTDSSGPGIQLDAENSTAVAVAVREGTVDLGFIESPAVPADLGAVTIAHDTLAVVVQPGHRWAKSARITARELSDTSLVLREPGSGTRQAFEAALADTGCSPHASPVAVLSTTLGVRSAIMAGVAPGVLSSLAVAEDLRAGRLARVQVRGLTMTRPLTAIWAGASPSRHAHDFLDALA